MSEKPADQNPPSDSQEDSQTDSSDKQGATLQPSSPAGSPSLKPLKAADPASSSPLGGKLSFSLGAPSRGASSTPASEELMKKPTFSPPSAPISQAPCQDDDYLSIFLTEAEENVTYIQETLTLLEKDLETELHWESLRLRFHTIRGAAATFGYGNIVNSSTDAEDICLKCVDSPEERTRSNWEKLQTLFDSTASHIDSLEKTSATPQPIPQITTPTLKSATGASVPISRIIDLQSLLGAWKSAPQERDIHSEFIDSLEHVRTALLEANRPRLATSFQELRSTLLRLDLMSPPETLFIVLERCLQDAKAFLESLKNNPDLLWSRRWNLYFRSLEVAMASQYTLLNGTTPSSNESSLSEVEEIDPEMAEIFAEEADQQFEALDKLVIDWEKGHAPEETGHAIRRCFHTLKGAANSIGLISLGSNFHELEDLIEEVRHQSPTPELFALLFRCLDEGRRQLAALQSGEKSNFTPWKVYVEAFRKGSPLPELAPPSTGTASSTAQSPDIDPEMLEVFMEEAAALFPQMENTIMTWEKGEGGTSAAQDHQNALRRHTHTLKGAANSIGLSSIGSQFHLLEDFMQELNEETLPNGLFSFLLNALDQMRDYLEALQADASTTWSYDWQAELNTLKGVETDTGLSSATVTSGAKSVSSQPTTASASKKQERQVIRVDAEKLRELMNIVAELIADRTRFGIKLETLLSLRGNLTDNVIRLRNAAEVIPEGGSRFPSALPEMKKNVLNNIHNTHELNAMMNRVVDSFKEDDVSFHTAIKRLQSDLAGLNMMPASSLFRRLQRTFRDALQEENKQAELLTEGDETLLDKVVLDQLYGPLLHIVRNAVAHGIESPKTRQERGKPSTGTVILRARPYSNQVTIEVRDDGNGIHGAAVRKRAIDRGLIPESTDELNHDQIVDLLFQPGFSTAEKVSTVAGRGVGLDVVKEEIEIMNGSVAVTYEEGKGATWTIKVPLTLSASESLLVGSGSEKFAIPLNYVDQCILLRDEQIHTKDGITWYRHGSEELPLMGLSTLLGSKRNQSPPHGVIVDAGRMRGILGVTELIARQEIVTRDLGPLVGKIDIFSGATVDSDGSLMLILQVPNLLRKLGHPMLGREASGTETPLTHIADLGLNILLVDDSASVRKMQKKQLQAMGHQVTLAKDGQEALDRLKESPSEHQLILTDLEMPVMDGFQLVEALRSEKDPTLSSLPVLLVTSRATDDLDREAKEKGASGCIGKPFSETLFQQHLRLLELA